MQTTKPFSALTKSELWNLRREIVLNSIYVGDYVNTFGYDAHDVADFFDGFVCYIDELAGSEGIPFEHGIERYDNKEDLWAWRNCYDNLDWVKYAR